MQNRLPERTEGHLFEDKIWVSDAQGLVQAILVADNLDDATVLTADDTSRELYKGKLVYKKSHDHGNPTRVLVFVDNSSGQEIIIDENRLTR